MNSFKLKAKIEVLEAKSEDAQNKIDIANSSADMKIKTLELGIEKCKADRNGKIKILQSKKDILDKDIENNGKLLREQKMLEFEGMGYSSDDDEEE